MNTLKIDGLTFEINEPTVINETVIDTEKNVRIEVSKHFVVYTSIENMSVYWDEENDLFKIYTGVENVELFVNKEVAEKAAEFLNITKWAYDNYDNIVTLQNGEWVYTEI
ncbi:hypothetical protein spd_00010 [Shewanella phage Dolos]|nr:hypothetical protein spd_00010 [Shewanella phage Dolos]